MTSTAADLSVLLFVCIFGAIWLPPMALRMLHRAYAVRRWIKTDAHIEHVSVEDILSGSLSAPPFGGLPLKQITARYRYEFRGNHYAGTVVNIRDANYPLDINFDRTLAERLHDAKRTQAVVEIWLNPRDPRQSIISRDPYSVRLNVFFASSLACLLGIFQLVRVLPVEVTVFSAIAALVLGLLVGGTLRKLTAS